MEYYVIFKRVQDELKRTINQMYKDAKISKNAFYKLNVELMNDYESESNFNKPEEIYSNFLQVLTKSTLSLDTETEVYAINQLNIINMKIRMLDLVIDNRDLLSNVNYYNLRLNSSSEEYILQSIRYLSKKRSNMDTFKFKEILIKFIESQHPDDLKIKILNDAGLNISNETELKKLIFTIGMDESFDIMDLVIKIREKTKLINKNTVIQLVCKELDNYLAANDYQNEMCILFNKPDKVLSNFGLPDVYSDNEFEKIVITPVESMMSNSFLKTATMSNRNMIVLSYKPSNKEIALLNNADIHEIYSYNYKNKRFKEVHRSIYKKF